MLLRVFIAAALVNLIHARSIVKGSTFSGSVELPSSED